MKKYFLKFLLFFNKKAKVGGDEFFSEVKKKQKNEKLGDGLSRKLR